MNSWWKRFLLAFFITFLCFTTISSCCVLTRRNYDKKVQTQSSSITRTKEELPDGVIIIDPEAVALANNLTASSPLCVDILDCINKERRAVGVKELVKGGDLAAAAAIRAKEIVNPFSHTRPNGTEWWTVNSAVCYGENLAYGFTTAKEVVDAWINSPAHKEVMLANDFISCGIGVYTYNDVIYFSAEFGY